MPAEKTLLTEQVLCAAVDGTILASPATDHVFCFTSVATDSRQVVSGTLFVPLLGENQDGHRFIPQAVEKGASVILISNTDAADYANLALTFGCVFIAVKNTMTALQRAAAAYLDCFPSLLKIGITGSSGKTTTKEILGSILSLKYDVVMNEGNLNSETGLPLSVFKIRKNHQIGIFEAGMNRKGELAELAAVLRPSVAVITNIGTAHIGILGSRQAIAEEKKNIFSYFTDSSQGFIYEEDPYKNFLKTDVLGSVMEFGSRTTPYLVQTEDNGLDGTALYFTATDGHIVRADLPLPGVYNMHNACAAASVAFALGIDVETVCAGISHVAPLFGRSQRITVGGITFILDCYNANPDSMENAIGFCDSVCWSGRKVYVIGEMLELGSDEKVAHQKIGNLLRTSDADMIFMYGNAMAYAAAVVCDDTVSKSYFYTCNMAELSEHLHDFCNSGDLVFVKGSRGCALERAVSVFTATSLDSEVHH